MTLAVTAMMASALLGWTPDALANAYPDTPPPAAPPPTCVAPANVVINGGTVTNSTTLDLSADGGTGISDASGGDDNLALTGGKDDNDKNKKKRNRRDDDTTTSAAGNGGVSDAGASGGSIAAEDVNSGGNVGNAIAVGDTVGSAYYCADGSGSGSGSAVGGVYIDANFKETQLARLQPGQPVAIQADAFSGEAFEGRIASLSPASGSVFTLLPPDNATGNFTKIVQRVPVRILIPAEVAARNVLRAGMSVVVKVNTKPSPPGADQTSPAAAASPR